MAAAAIVLSLWGTAESLEQGREAARAQESQIRAQRAVDTAKASREKRAALREKRIIQAQLAQSAQASGVSGSSGALGAAGVLSTSFAVNQGFAAGLQEARNVTDDAIIRQTRAQLGQQLGQSVANIGFDIFRSQGGFSSLFSSSVESDVENIFNEPGLF